MTSFLRLPRTGSGQARGEGVPAGHGVKATPAGPTLVRSERTFEPAVDGLRAIATCMVLLVHLAQWTGGMIDENGEAGPFARVMTGFQAAVPIFLIISGYLLYRPWVDATLSGRAAPKAAHFFWHRFLRVFPAYWLLIVTALVAFDRDRLGDTWRTVRLLSAQHVQHWQDLRADPGVVSHWAQTWTIGTEIHFYLALPLVAFVLHRVLTLRHGTRVSLALLAGVAVLDVIWLVSTTPSDPFGPPSLWWLRGYLGFLAAGMAFAIVAGRAAATGRHTAAERLVARHPWVCWGVALIALAMANTDWAGSVVDPAVLTKTEATVRYVCHMLIAAGLAAPLLLARGSGPELLLSRPVPQWLGRNSYGIYLWHLVIMQVLVRHVMDGEYARLDTGDFFVLLPFVTLLSILAGWLSYTLVERPVLRRFRIRRLPR
ncbi:acyltransferase family protein [Streptomyces sp. P1-3]|uniref:acyltransferase family protein n=1 Tax=Streptomyces sp. P1-3 TaxID=3421658 RepID=UPI003D361C9E